MSSHTVQTVKNSIKMLLGQIGVNLFSLGFGVYFAHALSLKEMAVLAVSVLISNLFPMIASLGMNDTLMKKIPALLEQGREDEAKKYFMSSLNVQIITTTFLVCLSLIFYKEISTIFYKSALPFSTMIIINSYAFMRSLILITNAMIRARQHFGRLATVRIVEQVLSRCASIGFFFIWQINGLLLGMLIGSFVSFFLQCYFLKDFVRHKMSYIETMNKIVRYSFPYYVASWLRFSLMQSDKYFVSIFFHPEQLAVYFVAGKIIELVTQVIDSIADPITSKVAQLKVYGVEKLESAFKKIFRYYSLLYIPLIGLIIGLARPCIELYGGKKYGDGANILMILALGLLLVPFSGIIDVFVFIMGKPVERFKIRLISGVFSLLGSLALMKIFGVKGLALSKLFIWGIYALVGALILKKFLRISIDKDILIKVTKLFFPIIMLGVIIQVFFYEIYLISIYFIVFLLMLGLFYVKIIKKEPELYEFLPKYFKRSIKGKRI